MNNKERDRNQRPNEDVGCDEAAVCQVIDLPYMHCQNALTIQTGVPTL